MKPWKGLPVFMLLLFLLLNCGSNVKYESGVFKNGLQFVFLESDDPISSAVFIINCGDVDGDAGLTGVTADYLLRGTEVRTADQMIEEVEQAGGYIQSESSLTHTTVLIESPSATFETCFDILMEAVAAPSFDEDPDVYRIKRKKRIIGTLGREKSIWDDSPIRSMLFEGSSLSKALPAQPESFSRSQVRDHYNAHFIPANMVLAVSGRIDKKRLLASLSHHWDLQERAPSASRSRDTGSRSSEKTVVKETGRTGERILMGFRAPAPMTREALTGSIMEFLLTHGKTSLLRQALVERGWEDVYCHAYYYDAPGLAYMVIVLDVQDGEAEEGIRFLNTEISKLQNGVSEEAVEIAKRKVLTYYYSAIQYAPRKAILTAFAKQGDTDYQTPAQIGKGLANVTGESVQTFARKFLADPAVVVLK